LGIIPKNKDKLIWNKLEFEVIDMDGVKIDKVLVSNIKVSIGANGSSILAVHLPAAFQSSQKKCEAFP
jgi:hypothetical protein